jgi:hypothetical protein
VRPLLLIRKRGYRGWRQRAGYYIRRRGAHGFFDHRLWSRDGTIMWGYTTSEGWLWRSNLGETWRAIFYEGRVAMEEPRHSPELHSRHRPHALVADRCGRLLRAPRRTLRTILMGRR